MTGTFQRLMDRYGQTVTHTPGTSGEAVTLRAFLQPLLQREERILVRVGGDGDNDAVEEFRRAANDVQMPVVHGIEAARIKRHARRKMFCLTHVCSLFSLG